MGSLAQPTQPIRPLLSLFVSSVWPARAGSGVYSWEVQPLPKETRLFGISQNKEEPGPAELIPGAFVERKKAGRREAEAPSHHSLGRTGLGRGSLDHSGQRFSGLHPF